jgi:8-oxo-dGTP pyrophosphatase MutT (NUDIX family)
MPKKTRVRGILIDANQEMLTLRRERAAQPVYWVLPGGGVDDTDISPEAALAREIQEEIGGEIIIEKLIFTSDLRDIGRDEVELFFLCNLLHWTGTRSGPEFQEPSRGSYSYELVSLSAHPISALNLVPPTLKEFLVRNAHRLRELPDLRR